MQITDPRALTEQEADFINLVARGTSITYAGKQVGWTSAEAIDKSGQPHIVAAIQAIQDFADPNVFKSQLKNLEFTRDDATMLLFEAHKKSANATEEVKVISELIKLHGISAPEKKEITITVDSPFEELTDEELLKHAGAEGFTIDDAEYTTVCEQEEKEEKGEE